ncbi:uncharacterized protein LOC129587854 [Paramacrobiotus metropolitanus]|uniref:uncharacterized protein LOC129587854 n=1 Tax=Paramacrobiotus metropolitanus TaxID=2943436 RepID=UPI0024459FDF|nr:uncharacterized protein LOC129587854 [Paramacrobiotus metropolitanus]
MQKNFRVCAIFTVLMSVSPAQSDWDAPQNYPSWFLIPQRLAGYPLYLPQQPIFADYSSSSLVDTWNQFRNEFSDMVPYNDPDSDPFYDHFEEYTAGKRTFPPSAAPAAARPAREFVDARGDKRRKPAAAKSIDRTKPLSEELVEVLMKIATANSNLNSS